MTLKATWVSRVFSLGILIGLNLFFCNPLSGQAFDEFHLSHYTSKNGLPQNSIRSMVLDKDRFLWMATESGLVRFDGYDFDLYNASTTKGLTNERMASIKSLVTGELISDDVDGNIVEIKTDGIKSIHRVQKSRGSGYWMRGGFPNLSFVVNADLEKISGIKTNFNNTEEWYHVLPIDNERFLISMGSDIGLYSNKESRITQYLNPEGFTIVSSFKLNNDIYILDANGACMVLNPESLQFKKAILTGFSKQKVLLDKVIWNYEQDQTFLINGKELYRIEKKNKILHLTLVLNQLPENCLITEVIFDQKSESYFVGTTTKGLFIFRKKSIRTLLAENPTTINTNCFYSQIELDSHRVITNRNWEFNQMGSKLSSHELQFGSAQFDFSLKINNSVYFVLGGNLLKYDLITKQKTQISAEKRTYFASYQDDDTIYFTSSSGIHGLIDDSLFLLSRTKLSGFNKKITSIVKGPDGLLWMANCNGILTYNISNRTVGEIPEMTGLCVRIIEKISDIYFIGTYGQGYYAFYQGKFRKLPLDKLEKLKKTHSFLLDGNGLIWMSTNTGLLNTPIKEIMAFLSDSTKLPYFYYYDTEDGILNTEFNGGCHPTYIRLKNGFVSYPTMEGLVWLKPEEALRDLPDERIFIDEIQINGEKLAFQGNLEISSYSDEVILHFSSPYWGHPDNLQLEYRIKGFNDKWRQTEGGGRWIDFAHLPHGEYSLEIRNMISSNESQALTLKIPIIIQPEFYETTAFMFGGLLSGILILFGLFHLNSARIVRQNRLLEEQVVERTSDLQKTNDTLNVAINNLQEKEYKLRESIRIKDKLISIISHDIITPIKFLSIVSKMTGKNDNIKPMDPKETMDNMRYIGAAAEKIYNNAANILNWIKLQNELIKIEPENIGLYDFVDEVISPLEDVIDKDAIQMVNKVGEEDIIIADPNILKIVLQNILSNAVKYTKEGSITVYSFIEDNGSTRIVVEDTGMGIPEKIIEKIKTIKKHTVTGEFDADDPDTGNQLGYFIVFDFARLINATVDIESEVGKGTKVSIVLPPPAQSEMIKTNKD